MSSQVDVDNAATNKPRLGWETGLPGWIRARPW